MAQRGNLDAHASGGGKNRLAADDIDLDPVDHGDVVRTVAFMGDLRLTRFDP
jgi:hypothetical protein